MAIAFVRSLQRVSSLLRSSYPLLISARCLPQSQEYAYSTSIFSTISRPICRNFSNATVNLVISDGKPKFETRELEPPKKYKWLRKKRFKLKLKKEREERNAANRKNPRQLTVKRKKRRKFANAEERIKYNLERAKIKEALLIEKLKRYEVDKAQGPEVRPHEITGEERFYLKKMGQKGSNYVPIGRRGVFGGVILNMHMHWKKHETVKVICNNSKPGQVQQVADELAKLSGGLPVNIIGNDTIIFYRGKDYVQPKVMSPVDTLTKKRAYEKSKYEQSLESVKHSIAILEKELELYYRHVSLYDDPNNRNPLSILDDSSSEPRNRHRNELYGSCSETEDDDENEELYELDNGSSSPNE